MRHLLLALLVLPGCASTGSTQPESNSNGSGSTSTGNTGATSSGPSSTTSGSPTSSTSSTSAVDGGGGGGGSDAAAAGCANLPLCDDFESDTVGGPPNAQLWKLFGLAGCSGMGNPGASPVFSITVDNTQHHSGTNSVKIDTTQAPSAGCGPWLVNTSAFPKITGGELYGRYYVHLSDTTMNVNHVALMALGLQTVTPDGGVGFDVQNPDSFLSLACEHDGFTSNSLCWQRSDGNGVIPAQNSMGTMQTTYPAATGFTCIEFHTSASTSAIETWVNGTAVAGLTDPPTPAGVANWVPPSPLAVTSFGLGWQIYSGPGMTVWIDDVALSTSRIGCN